MMSAGMAHHHPMTCTCHHPPSPCDERHHRPPSPCNKHPPLPTMAHRCPVASTHYRLPLPAIAPRLPQCGWVGSSPTCQQGGCPQPAWAMEQASPCAQSTGTARYPEGNGSGDLTPSMMLAQPPPASQLQPLLRQGGAELSLPQVLCCVGHPGLTGPSGQAQCCLHTHRHACSLCCLALVSSCRWLQGDFRAFPVNLQRLKCQ